MLTTSMSGPAKAIDAQGIKILISNGTTIVPVRALVEALSGSVGWKVPVVAAKSISAVAWSPSGWA
jgi:hypothetical protein